MEPDTLKVGGSAILGGLTQRAVLGPEFFECHCVFLCGAVCTSSILEWS